MPKRTDIRAILIIGLLALSSCSYSFPSEQNCEKRFSKLSDEFEYVHTQLRFDFTNADDQRIASILKNGFAGSGTPGTVTVMGSKKHILSNSKTGAPVVNHKDNEILIDGPSGEIKSTVAKACAMEAENVWLKSISIQPFIPTDAEMSKIAE